MPLVNKTFNQLIDFTRTSSATYVDATGKIVPTAASRNLLTFTQEFDNAAWAKSGATVYPFNPATATQGPELVTNGDFSNGTTGWTAANSATLSNSSNRLSVVNGGTGLGQARSTITTVPGRVYRIAATFTSVASSRGSVFIGTFAGDNSLFSDSPITTSKSVVGYFTATGTTTHIAVGNTDNTLALEVLFDDISVKELSGGLIAAPDGTLTADKLVDDTATALHFSSQTVTVTAGLHTFSTYVKAAGRNFAFLYHGASNTGLSVNLSTGALGQPTGTVAPTASSVTAVGNGWYRVTMTATTTAGSNNFRVYLATSLTGSASYAGDGISGIFIWGAQLEAGSTLTDYTRNVGGVYPPRFDYDPATLAPKGLLIEEARTNLFLYSEDLADATWGKNWGGGVSVTSNQANGPDGAQNLDLVTSSGLDGAAYQLFATAFNAAHSVSFFVRQGTAASSRLEISNAVSGPTASVTFSWTGGVPSTSSTGGTPTNIKFENYGGGLYRVSFSFVSGGSGANLVLFAPDSTAGLGTSYAGYFQLEAGAFATSYIPTVASQVTRTADVATITGANFSQWYNQSEGSFVAEVTPIAVSTSFRPFQASDGTDNERISTSAGAASHFIVTDGGVDQCDLDAGTFAAGTTGKLAVAYRLNDFAASLNGSAAVTDTTGTIPTVDRLFIGARSSSLGFLNGHIRSFAYYPTRLSNAQLQALTA